MSKLAWRRTWFQVHKWIGLILAILIIPLCITGSALVWHDALDEAVNPQRYATSGSTAVDASGLCDGGTHRAEARRPDRIVADGRGAGRARDRDGGFHRRR